MHVIQAHLDGFIASFENSMQVLHHWLMESILDCRQLMLNLDIA